MSTEPTWVRSSKCESGSCWEVAQPDGEDVLVRCSRDTAMVLAVEPAAYAEFVEAAARGEFDERRLTRH